MSELADKLAGRFIVVDGPDGAGKSTQIHLLAQWLGEQGVPLTQVRDPGGTAIGDRIREILLDKRHGEMAVECELMLYMASRAQLVRQIIRPALAQGRCVLADRYISSTIAYQGAGGADVDAIRRVADVAVGGLWPDLTIVLDIESEEGLRRAHRGVGHDRMELKGLEFHRKVRQGFAAQAHAQADCFRVVDAAGSVEAVSAHLRQALVEWATRRP